MMEPTRIAIVLALVGLGAGAAPARAQETTAPSEAAPTDVQPVASAESGRAVPTLYEAEDDASVVPVDPPRVLDDLRLGHDDSGLGNGAWLSAGVFAGDVRDDAITMGTIDLGLRLAIVADARVTLDWGFAIADTRVRGAYIGPTTNDPFDVKMGRVEGRNADLRIEWLPLVSNDIRFGFGLGGAVPVAATTRLPSSAATQSYFDASTLVHDGYLAENGGYRPWRYRPEHAAIYLPLTLAIGLSRETVLAFDGTAAVGLRVLGGQPPDAIADLVLGAELASQLASILRLGVRANVAALALGSPSANAQPSAEGWARLELAPVSVIVRATIGLGGPYGVGSNFVGWGLHAGAGVSF
ncbi:MAG: hypothetical protein K1X94_22935 [Sandaracinaceae bacterium]|nr:hypothetical protein [Sandaracinaceae bacterium]